MAINSAILSTHPPIESLPTDGLQDRGVCAVKQIFLRHCQSIILVDHLRSLAAQKTDIAKLIDRHSKFNRQT